jgi:hypothetical protein
MNPQLPAHDVATDRPIADAAAMRFAEAPPPIVDVTIGESSEVANEASASLDSVRNPLWIIVIAMACFFGIMALALSLQ